MLVGLAEASLDLIVEYAKVRETFGRKIGSWQAVRHPCADMAVRVEAARAQLWYAATALRRRAATPPRISMRPSTWPIRPRSPTPTSNIQLHGGIGVTDEHDAHLLLKHAMLLVATVRRQARAAGAAAPRAAGGLTWTSIIPKPTAQFRARARELAERERPQRHRGLRTAPGARSSIATGSASCTTMAGPASPGPRNTAGLACPGCSRSSGTRNWRARKAPHHINTTYVALMHAGPTVIARGTEAQKAFHLPRILSGEALWCQGFSEPNAGSDLASLKTRGVIDGDHIVVTGAKMWTTDAQYADYQELLIRTDPASERHKGLTWLICDMKSPGIDIKPIRTMLQDEHVNMVFYDEVRIPVSNVVGEIGKGWSTALATLSSSAGSASSATSSNFTSASAARSNWPARSGSRTAAARSRMTASPSAWPRSRPKRIAIRVDDAGRHRRDRPHRRCPAPRAR